MPDTTVLDVDGRELPISSPDKLVFPRIGVTKLELIDYYRRVAEHLLPHCLGRPCNLERFPGGVEGKGFVQKRLPERRPDWLGTVEVVFGSGRKALELCPASLADVLWSANLGGITVHPWALRRPEASPRVADGAAFDEPDELRLDLDPSPGSSFASVRRVARVVGDVLVEQGLVGFPKTSGSTGIHVLVRIERRPYLEVRAAAVALAREVERRLPGEATAAWWKEERGEGSVFIDYNQNLWDRTTACAYSVRPVADARVSFPFPWSELDDVEPEDATIATVPTLLAERGDATAALEDEVGSIDGLLGLAEADRRAGLPDLPLPPHYPKTADEPPRVPPSRAARGGS